MSTKAGKSKERRRGKGLGLGEIVVVVIIVIVAVWAAYSLAQPPPPTPTLSGGAPDFTLPVIGPNGPTGEKLSLSQFHGKVVLLEFMVPQCSHCQNMAPVLETLHGQYSGSNVVFISVASPFSYGATPSDVAAFIRTYHSTSTYVWDSSGTVFSLYGVNATPTFFVITKNGSIANTYQGEVSAAVLATEINRVNT